MYKINFNIIKKSCKYLEPCVDGLTCRNEINISNKGSWGNCSKNYCPMITKNVVGAIYKNDKKIAGINTIKFK